jgi:hypothetical protein
VTLTARTRASSAEYAGPVLLAALAAGLLGQGGYAGRSRQLVGVLVAVAGLVTLSARTGSARARPRRTWAARGDAGPTPAHEVVAAFGALSGWALLDGVLHGDAVAGVGPALLAVGCAAALGVCRRLPESGREMLVGGLVAVGLLVAAAGGSVWRCGLAGGPGWPRGSGGPPRR